MCALLLLSLCCSTTYFSATCFNEMFLLLRVQNSSIALRLSRSTNIRYSPSYLPLQTLPNTRATPSLNSSLRIHSSKVSLGNGPSWYGVHFMKVFFILVLAGITLTPITSYQNLAQPL